MADDATDDPFDIALRNAVRSVRGDGVVTTRPLEMIKERVMRRMVQKMQAGMPLDPYEQAALSAHTERQREVSDQAADVGMQGAVGLGAGMLLGPAASAYMALPRAAQFGLPFAYGMTNAAKDATPGPSTADRQELIRQLEHQGSPEMEAARAALAAAEAEVQKSVQGAQSLTQMHTNPQQGERRPSQEMLNTARAAQAAALERRNAALKAFNAELARVREVSSQRADAVMTARGEGQAERERILADAPKPFHKVYEGVRQEVPLLPDSAMLPFAAGAGAVAAKQVFPIASSWIARAGAQRVANAGPMTAEKAATLNTIANRSAGNPRIMDMGDVATGAASGFTFGALPLAYNGLNQSPMNPEHVAASLYASKLLDIDPSKARAVQQADAIPAGNPLYEQARDPKSILFALGMGALEGGAGGKLAGLVTESMKPRFSNIRNLTEPFSDDVAAEAIRMRQAAAYANQSVRGSVPKPAPYQPQLPPGLPAQYVPPLAGPRLLAPPGPAQPALVPPPGTAVSYGSYGSLPNSIRDNTRNAYAYQRTLQGEPLPDKQTAQGIKAALQAKGIDAPVTPARLRATETEVQKFIAREGRQPSSHADWAQIWTKATLAAPPVAAGIAATEGEQP